VLELEVLDVDPLGRERLRDPGEDTGPVGNVDAELLERARVGIHAFEQASAVAGRLADPAREEAGIAPGERSLDLLEPATVLRQGVADRLGVLEEDVDPDARVRPRDPRDIAE
jgi:hypothetical protein